MSNTAALLGNLLTVNADINYYTQQQIYWANKYQANSAKLAKQVKFEEKWEAQYDSAMDGGRSSALKMNGYVFLDKEVAASTDTQARQWADYKVSEYDEELSLELADLDIEYDTMKCMYETLLEELRAEKDADKQATSTAATDTGLLGQ